MKNDYDPKLREVLGAWQVSPPPARDFKNSVWRRIAVEEEHAGLGFWDTLRDWLVVQLPKPVYASALLALTVVVGVTAGNLRATHMREQARVANAREYLASIDPIVMSQRSPHMSP